MKKSKIAIATVQADRGSTIVGRILPLVEEFERLGYDCHVLALRSSASNAQTAPFHIVGNQPWHRTEAGKERMRGFSLVINMLSTAFRTAWALHRLKPEIVIISKPLPANTLGVWLYALLTTNYKLILDADDFELTANKLSSIAQRAVIHWSERLAAKLADSIVVASPFLSDHFKQLTQNTKPITIIPTGISAPMSIAPGLQQRALGTHLAYIGSVSVSSGHRVDLLPDILQKIVATHPSATLLIAGDGDDVAALKEQFRQRGLEHNVTWHGRFTPGEVEGLLSPSSILLDPVDDSIANRAKSSFRVMLAAARGLPVVTSNIGIRPELIPAPLHARFFADPGSPDSYATIVEALITSPLTDADRTALTTHAERYTWARLASRYCDILTV